MQKDKVYKNHAVKLAELIIMALDKGETVIIEPMFAGDTGLKMATIALQGKNHRHPHGSSDRDFLVSMTESMESMVDKLNQEA